MLGILGGLDIVSFLRTYDTALYDWDTVSAILDWDMGFWDKVLGIGIPILDLILVLLLPISGVLLVLGKKAGIVVYCFEFPLRLLFITLTFGFILRISGLNVDSFAYRIVLAFIAALELLRLIFFIWTQRRYRSTVRTASP